MSIPLHNLKICGLTSRDTARFCAEAGVGALGVIFYPPSPRCVSPAAARALFEGLPPRVARVGVFVDAPADELLATAREAGLDAVQLHGAEPPATVERALAAGLRVIQVLKTTGAALLAAARALPPAAGLLVECGRGALPGGNGAAWDWASAAPLADLRPFALAGGLAPGNLAEAARISRACAWDLSSGVETAPGVKDHAAIARAVAALRDFLSRQPAAPGDYQQPSTAIERLRFWAPSQPPASPPL